APLRRQTDMTTTRTEGRSLTPFCNHHTMLETPKQASCVQRAAIVTFDDRIRQLRRRKDLTRHGLAAKVELGYMAASRGQSRSPVFATGHAVILAHGQTIAVQGEKKDGHCEFHSSRRTSSTASSPWPHWRFTPGPCNQDPNGAACWSLVAQAP